MESKTKVQPLISMKKLDYLLIILIMLIYGTIAFYQLGDTVFPKTMWTGNELKKINASFAQEEKLTHMLILLGSENDKNLDLFVSQDGEEWLLDQSINLGSVFKWSAITVNQPAKFVRLVNVTHNTEILEMAFFNDDKLIPIADCGAEDTALFDEQDLVPEISTYMNSTYFDEIYHARTGYEFVNKEEIYETTHPPLGKVIIALGIQIFGMNPFGWRFFGTLFGVLMIPLIYLFAKALFSRTKWGSSTLWATFASVIFSFDFMHFTQTRIATIDTYVTFFIIAMYFFMYLFYKTDFINQPLRKSLIPLGLSGLSMGLAVASKWQGVYAALGLGVIFFYALYLRHKEYKKSKGSPKYFAKKAKITILSCVVFFIIVPLIIYCLSYIPCLEASGIKGFKESVDYILGQQSYMFNYHSGLRDTHPFASPWYEWPLIIRPVFYYAQNFPDGLKSGISTMGNPAVWWFGLVALIICIFKFRKDKTMQFLLVAFASQYLPWVLIPRITYIYHYFPAIPFLVFMITFLFSESNLKYRKYYMTAFAIVTVALFALFYPVIVGLPVQKEYIELLRWLPGWQFYLLNM